MQQLRQIATAARANAVDREEIKSDLDRSRLEQAEVQVELDEAKQTLYEHTTAFQIQVSKLGHALHWVV